MKKIKVKFESNRQVAFKNKKALLSQRLLRDACDRTIRQYAHGLLPESPFVPSSTDWQNKYRQNKAKTAVSVAVEAKPEVEIWWRPKKSKER